LAFTSLTTNTTTIALGEKSSFKKVTGNQQKEDMFKYRNKLVYLMNLYRSAQALLACTFLSIANPSYAQKANSPSGLKKSLDQIIVQLAGQQDNIQVKRQLEKLAPANYIEPQIKDGATVQVNREGWVGQKYSEQELAQIKCGDTTTLDAGEVTYCYNATSQTFITHLTTYDAKKHPSYSIVIHDQNRNSASKGDFTRVSEISNEPSERKYTLSYVNDVMHNWDTTDCTGSTLTKTAPYEAATIVMAPSVKKIANGLITFFSLNMADNIDEKIRTKYQQILGIYYSKNDKNTRISEIHKMAQDKLALSPYQISTHNICTDQAKK
jgi:hypothetical protein